MNLPKVKLHGLERLCTVSKNSNYKIAVITKLSGPNSDIITNLRYAWTAVVNKHPRMRALLSRTDPFTAVIRPYLTVEEVLPLIKTSYAPEEHWQSVVEEETAVPFDRYDSISFSIHFFVHSPESSTMVIYMDHFMSDGLSAMHILNDMFVYLQTKETLDEEPLTKDIYSLRQSPLKKWCGKQILRLVKPFVGMKLKQYRPLFPLNTNQMPLDYPLPSNPTKGLFAKGKPENMKAVLKICKERGVSVNSAMLVAVLLAAAKTKHDELELESNFKMSMDVAYDLRRVSAKTSGLKVGAFSAATLLNGYKSNGVDLDKNFWKECQRAKKQMFNSYQIINFTLGSIDEYFSQNSGECFIKGQSGCVLSDVNVSNIGKYQFAREFKINGNKITLDGFYGHCAASNISAGANIYFLSADSFHYSMSHKFEETVARQFFDNLYTVAENLHTIGESESIREYGKRIFSI
ncbi:hypothetical protein BC833DRAFT_610652 [Globomyces pollinis-pini]|nr:hypothetical protein BC833DRAFT_610652 [Globomyces pollinis-pini]